jgi:hypothetical protein
MWEDDEPAAVSTPGRVAYAEQAAAGIVRGSQGKFVAAAPAPTPPPEMGSMAGAAPLAALTQSPGVHLVEVNATYDDRAAGFVRSTLPLWWAVSGAAAALVLVIWIAGPLSGRWAFALGWWVASELLVLAATSVGVWAAMWWRWHRDGPDAIASRSADARLRMAEEWFRRELDRVYGGDQ